MVGTLLLLVYPVEMYNYIFCTELDFALLKNIRKPDGYIYVIVMYLLLIALMHA